MHHVMEGVTQKPFMTEIFGLAMVIAFQNIKHVMMAHVLKVIMTVMGGVIKRTTMKNVFGLAMVNASQNIINVMVCVLKIIKIVMGTVC